MTVFQIHINGAAGHCWKLFGNDARGTEQHGSSRIQDPFTGDLLHVVGDQNDVYVGNVLSGERLSKIERTVKAAIQRLFERRFGALRCHGPEMKNLPERVTALDYVSEEGIVVCTNSGPDGISAISGSLITGARVDQNHILSRIPEFRGDLIAEAK